MTAFTYDYPTQTWQPLEPYQEERRAAIRTAPVRSDRERPAGPRCKLPHLDRKSLTEEEARELTISQRYRLRQHGVDVPKLKPDIGERPVKLPVLRSDA
jgi:hypothetical protein